MLIKQNRLITSIHQYTDDLCILFNARLLIRLVDPIEDGYHDKYQFWTDGSVRGHQPYKVFRLLVQVM